jgi:O-antigen/teichoic acid export membrane protein
MGAFSIGQVRRSLLHFALGKGLGMVLGFALLLLLVRALSTADYAFYIASLALLEVVGQLSSVGVLVLAQRYLPEMLTRYEGRKLRRAALLLCLARAFSLLVAAGLLFWGADWLMQALALQSHAWALKLYLIVVVAESFARFMDVVFDSLLLQGFSQVSLLLRAGVRVAGVVWALQTNPGQDMALVDWIVVDAVAAVAGCLWSCGAIFWFVRRTATQYPGSDDRLELRRYMRYSVPTFLAVLIYLASGQSIVKLVAARLLDATQFAAFGFAANLSAMLQRYLPLFLLIGMIRPLLVAARDRDDYRTRLPAMAALVFKLNVFVLMPLAAFLAACGKPLTLLLTGGRYPEAGGYILLFVLLLLAQALRGVMSMTAQAMEDARAPLVGTFLGLAGIVIGILLSLRYGGYGLCIGMVISELTFGLWVGWALSKRSVVFVLDLPGYRNLMASAVIAGVAAALGGHWLEATTLLSLIGIGAFSMLTFVAVAYVFKPFSDAERDTINRLLKRRLFVW